MILRGDCLERMKELADNSVDAVITDPPYGLAFMGKKWDYDVPSVEVWREVLRVMKPGAHLLSFGGTRTYHRMVVAIEDAGFEIRDQLQWLYGSGFHRGRGSKIYANGKGFTNTLAEVGQVVGYDDIGGASRFFYVAKASKSERNAGLDGRDVHRYGAGLGEGKHPESPVTEKNFHPTVKPIKLMEYLCRLITPPCGTILDPFMGSGTTGIAAKRLGFEFIGIEMNEEYCEIAERRIATA